jgi:hypothetical protein
MTPLLLLALIAALQPIPTTAQLPNVDWSVANAPIVDKQGAFSTTHPFIRLWLHSSNIVSSSGQPGGRVSSWLNG